MTVEHHPESNRFTLAIEGGAEAYIEYQARPDGTLDLLHTIVPAEARGRGIGARLVQQTLESARRDHLRIIPSCPFIHLWLQRHPDFQDVVAS